MASTPDDLTALMKKLGCKSFKVRRAPPPLRLCAAGLPAPCRGLVAPCDKKVTVSARCGWQVRKHAAVVTVDEMMAANKGSKGGMARPMLAPLR